MSDIIVDVVTVEASTLTVNVIAPPPAAVVVEVGEWGSVPIGYPQLPVELAQVPIAFPFAGRPTAGTFINVPMAFSLGLPVDLAGAVTFAMGAPTFDAPFLVNRISGGITSTLGTITLTANSNTVSVLVGSGGALAIGDVLQLVAPLGQDPTMSDVGITILANRE